MTLWMRPYNILVPHFDRKLPSAVETSRREVNGADDGSHDSSAQSSLACSLRPLILCTLTPTSSRMRNPPTPSMSLLLLQRCGAAAP